MPVPTRLDEAFEDILDAVVGLLKTSADTPGSELEDLRSEDIVRGDRDIAPRQPSLMVFAEPALPSQTHAHMEFWTVPVVVLASVEENDPAKGYRQAAKFAAGARRVILRDAGRRLGLTNFVQDTQSARFEAAAPWSKRGTLYEALAVVNVIFTVFEP